jgi:hypothetical protein
MKRLLRLGLFPAILFSPFSLLPQGSANLIVVARVDPLPPSPGWKYGEVTGAGELAIIGGFASNSNVWIYDLANKTQPLLLAAIPLNTPSWDVQVHGRYLFIALTNRMEWYDILDPAQPKLVKRFEPNPPINPHTFFVAGNTLYIADLVSDGIRIFDITDKKNPQPRADIIDHSWSIHDMTVIRKRLYGAWIFGSAGLLVADVSNPAAPKELAKIRYPQAGTHNAWPTEDEKYILTTDEISPSRNNLKIWDARTPGQLTYVIEREVQNASSPIHNVYVRGRYAYASYYCEGLRVFDIADPTQPREVAFYDFNTNANCAGFGSNWGVYPFANLIYASDMNAGLYVLEFADHPAANFTGTVIDADSNKPVRGAMVYFRDEYPTTRTNSAGGFDIPWFKNDTVKVVTEAPDYRPDTATVITSAANKTTLTIRLKRLTTSVDQPKDIPNEFALLAGYTNPMSLSRSTPAQIVFRLPGRAEVQLEVYNIYGQRVRRLLRAAREPGEHRFAWDGADDAGQAVTTGVYILRLRAGKFNASCRITVLR